MIVYIVSALVLTVPLLILIREMRAHFDDQIKSLITMSVMLVLYNLCCLYYYGVLFVGSFYSPEDGRNEYVSLADVGYAFCIFFWLQVHWIFTQHYLTLGKNLDD